MNRYTHVLEEIKRLKKEKDSHSIAHHLQRRGELVRAALMQDCIDERGQISIRDRVYIGDTSIDRLAKQTHKSVSEVMSFINQNKRFKTSYFRQESNGNPYLTKTGAMIYRQEVRGE